MRNTFINEVLSLAKCNERVWLLTGDLGFGVLEPFANTLPNRFINVGVAEQNMTGIAAGLALDGRTVFTYSIANFPTLRCLEQIRNDVCYHQLDVKIVSVGAGVSYGSHGYTHYGIEDIAIMRALPNLRLFCPADPSEARRVAQLAVENRGPVYIRLGKNGEPALHAGDIRFEVGELVEMLPAGDITILATGSIAYHAFQAAQQCCREGMSVGMFSCPSLVPFDVRRFVDIAYRARVIITVEEHIATGGLASIVAESLVHSPHRSALVSRALPHTISEVGKQDYLLCKHGLDSAGIDSLIRQHVQSLG